MTLTSMQPGVVRGDTIKLRFNMDGAIGSVEEFILDDRDARDSRDLITPASPAGRALLGHGVGDTVGYSIEGCSRYVEIEIIEIGSARG